MKLMFKELIEMTVEMLLAALGVGVMFAFAALTSGWDPKEWFLAGFASIALIVVFAWIIFIAIALLVVMVKIIEYYASND